jgi:hypothetical protein
VAQPACGTATDCLQKSEPGSGQTVCTFWGSAQVQIVGRRNSSKCAQIAPDDGGPPGLHILLENRSAVLWLLRSKRAKLAGDVCFSSGAEKPEPEKADEHA